MAESNKVVTIEKSISELETSAVELIRYARTLVVRQVNLVQLMTYFTLGRWVVEVEQGGEGRAIYGKRVIESLSQKLNSEFGKGFSSTTLKYIRQFYLSY